MYFDQWIKQQKIIPVSSFANWTHDQSAVAEMVYNAVYADQLRKSLAAQNRAGTANNNRSDEIADKIVDFYSTRSHLTKEDVLSLEGIAQQLRAVR